MEQVYDSAASMCDTWDSRGCHLPGFPGYRWASAAATAATARLLLHPSPFPSSQRHCDLRMHHFNGSTWVASSGSMAPGCYPHGIDDHWNEHCTMTKCIIYNNLQLSYIIIIISFNHLVVLVSVNMFQQHRCVLLHWHGKVQLAHLLRSRLSAALALRTAAEMWPSGPTSTLVGSVRLPQWIVMICHFSMSF